MNRFVFVCLEKERKEERKKNNKEVADLDYEIRAKVDQTRVIEKKKKKKKWEQQWKSILIMFNLRFDYEKAKRSERWMA